jgi:hypothetical protein
VSIQQIKFTSRTLVGGGSGSVEMSRTQFLEPRSPMPAQGMTMSIVLLGEKSRAALKAAVWESQDVTSVLMNCALQRYQ